MSTLSTLHNIVYTIIYVSRHNVRCAQLKCLIYQKAGKKNSFPYPRPNMNISSPPMDQPLSMQRYVFWYVLILSSYDVKGSHNLALSQCLHVLIYISVLIIRTIFYEDSHIYDNDICQLGPW